MGLGVLETNAKRTASRVQEKMGEAPLRHKEEEGSKVLGKVVAVEEAAESKAEAEVACLRTRWEDIVGELREETVAYTGCMAYMEHWLVRQSGSGAGPGDSSPEYREPCSYCGTWGWRVAGGDDIGVDVGGGLYIETGVVVGHRWVLGLVPYQSALSLRHFLRHQRLLLAYQAAQPADDYRSSCRLGVDEAVAIHRFCDLCRQYVNRNYLLVRGR